MFCMMEFPKTNESARMVAAAGFMLKHENMNASPMMLTAFRDISKCDST